MAVKTGKVGFGSKDALVASGFARARMIILAKNIREAERDDILHNAGQSEIPVYIIDEKLERIIFVAKPGDMGLAIGKGGKNINMLRRMTSRQIEVVEYAETPEALIRNSLAPARLKEVRVTERPDKKIVVVEVDPRDKAIAIGKNGRTIDKTRLLVKRYFDINHVVVS